VLKERMTHVHITPVQGVEMPAFMEALQAFAVGFDVEITSFDSVNGAYFTGTIKPSQIVTRWFDYNAFPHQSRTRIAHIDVHQHSIESVLGLLYKTNVIIATADGINAHKLMEVLRAFQEGFGAEAEFFDSQHGTAYLLGEARTVTASRIATEWSDKLSSYLSQRVAKIAVR